MYTFHVYLNVIDPYFFCFTFKLYICKYILEKNPTSIHPIFFTGVDLRVENIQLFFHRRVHTRVRDENVGTGTSALRKGQVRIRTHCTASQKVDKERRKNFDFNLIPCTFTS